MHHGAVGQSPRTVVNAEPSAGFKTCWEKGTVPICCADCANLGQSPQVLKPHELAERIFQWPTAPRKTRADQNHRHGRSRLPQARRTGGFDRSGGQRLSPEHGPRRAGHARRDAGHDSQGQRRAEAAGRRAGRPGRPQDPAGANCPADKSIAAWARPITSFAATSPPIPSSWSPPIRCWSMKWPWAAAIMLADGAVGMLVEEKDKDQLRCRVVQPGLVRSRQGLNLPGAKFERPGDGRRRPRARPLGGRQRRRFRRPELCPPGGRRPRAEESAGPARFAGPGDRQDRKARGHRRAGRNRDGGRRRDGGPGRFGGRDRRGPHADGAEADHRRPASGCRSR